MRFAEQVGTLSSEQRLHLYEVLAHNLTIATRGIWSDSALSDAVKVDRMKVINEILHRVTAKVWVLRLNTHEWTEEDFGKLIQSMVSGDEAVATDVLVAINQSYRAVAGKEAG